MSVLKFIIDELSERCYAINGDEAAIAKLAELKANGSIAYIATNPDVNAALEAEIANLKGQVEQLTAALEAATTPGNAPQP